MAKHVKGKLFENYVRMIRKLKHVDWSEHLPAWEGARHSVIELRW